MNRLTSKTALVTGSSRGMGRAAAIRLAREGALVAVHYTARKDAADDVVAEIEKDGGRAFTVRAELGVPGDVHELFLGLENGLRERTGSTDLDILVNNAGVMGGVKPEDTTPEKFDELFAVNAKAPFFLIQRALKNMPDGGRIINITSGLTRVANPEEIAYAMTKGAVDQPPCTSRSTWAPGTSPSTPWRPASPAATTPSSASPRRWSRWRSCPPSTASANRRTSQTWWPSSPPTKPAGSPAPSSTPLAAPCSADPPLDHRRHLPRASVRPAVSPHGSRPASSPVRDTIRLPEGNGIMRPSTTPRAGELAGADRRWSPALWGLLFVLAANMLLDALEVSVALVALPAIGDDLGLAPHQLHWVVSGFAAGFGALLLFGGRLVAILGRRPVYLAALLVFAAASLVGALADHAALLVATRFVKGFCAALTAPTGLAIIASAFPEGPARSRALSVYSLFGASGFSLGLLLSGALTEVSGGGPSPSRPRSRCSCSSSRCG